MSHIAEQSGVSLSTVSLALRDRPGVGVDTRQRVLEIAKELGYIPRNDTPLSLSVANIGLILKSEPHQVPQANPFYSQVLAGIESTCRQWHLNLMFATMPVDQDSYPTEIPRLLREGNTVDACLFVGAFVDDTLSQAVEHRSIPIVLVDAYAASDLYDAVVTDNTKGAKCATLHLIQQGHRHIGFVGNHPHAYPSIRDRFKGYDQALQQNDIAHQYVAECHITDREGSIEAITALLQSNPQITALLGANDDMAIAAMEAVRALGRQIPDDVSVVGFDNIDLAKSVTPSLTTMHVDKIGMGRLAVQLLINRVEYPDASHVTAVILPNLMDRESVRKC
jgi:LacI family transcriptional regulator